MEFAQNPDLQKHFAHVLNHLDLFLTVSTAILPPFLPVPDLHFGMNGTWNETTH
jgi:hypothetical protein